MLEESFCVLYMCSKLFFIFDQLYLMTDVSYGDGKVSFFSVFLALSSGVNNFIQEELFILMIITLGGKLRQKSRNPLEPPQYCQYSLALYLNVFYIIAGITTPNFTLV